MFFNFLQDQFARIRMNHYVEEKFERIAIIAHLPHFIVQDLSYSYEPYVREIEIWADIYKKVIIYTDVVKRKPLFSLKPLPLNCSVKPIFLTSGPGIIKKCIRILQLPVVFVQISLVYFNNKIIHTRSSGFPTIFVSVLNFIFNKRTIEKWATNFPPDRGVGRLDQLAAWLLTKARSRTRVMVYRKFPHPNFVYFFPALFTKGELDFYSDLIDKQKWFQENRIFVCVSRLHPDKNISLVIKAFAYLVNELHYKKFSINLVGDGPLRKQIELEVDLAHLRNHVHFTGSIPFIEVMGILAKSNFLIMPGVNEGWGKVINEALAAGCVPIVVKGGNAQRVMALMNDPGLLFDPDYISLADSILMAYNMGKEEVDQILERGRNANEKMVLEQFKSELLSLIQSLND